MAFVRPLITEVLSRIQGDLESRLPGTSARLPVSLTGILARMEAGAAHELYGALDWLSKNLLPDTSDPDILARWAAIYGVPRLQPAVAVGQVTFTGTDAAVVPAATLLQNSSGIQYALDADVTIAVGTGTGSITAGEAGAAGNQLEGATLTLVSPVAGIDSTITVATGGLAGGTDIEALDAWSARLISRIQQPPQGGTIGDYERWAKEASAAVTNAWVTAHESGEIGVVTVRIATYGDPAGDLPVAESPLLSLVYDYIDQRRPVAGGLQVFAPVAQPVDMTLAIKPDTSAVRAAAEEALSDLFHREARPGAFVPGEGDLLGTIPLTHVHEALSLVDDETDHQIQVIGVLAPASAGHMLTLGTITWAEWAS